MILAGEPPKPPARKRRLHSWTKRRTGQKLGYFPVVTQTCWQCRATLYLQSGVFGPAPRAMWFREHGSDTAKRVQRRPECCPPPRAVPVEPNPLQVWADDGGRCD